MEDAPPAKRQRLVSSTPANDPPPPPTIPSFIDRLLAALTATDVDAVSDILRTSDTPLTDDDVLKCYEIVLLPSVDVYANRRRQLIDCIEVMLADGRLPADATGMGATVVQLCEDERQLADILDCLLHRPLLGGHEVRIMLLFAAIMRANDRIVESIVRARPLNINYALTVGAGAGDAAVVVCTLRALHLALHTNVAHYSRRTVPVLLALSDVDPNAHIQSAMSLSLSPLALADIAYVKEHDVHADLATHATNSVRALLKHTRVDMHSMGDWQGDEGHVNVHAVAAHIGIDDGGIVAHGEEIQPPANPAENGDDPAAPPQE